MFLAPPSSGSHQRPDLGDLMAANVLVSLPPTSRLASSWQWPCAKPVPSSGVLDLPWLQGLCSEAASGAWVEGLLSAQASQGGRMLRHARCAFLASTPLVPPDPPGTSPLPPALVLPAAALLSSAGAVSHPAAAPSPSAGAVPVPSGRPRPGRLQWRMQTCNTVRLQAGLLPLGSSHHEHNTVHQEELSKGLWSRWKRVGWG